MMVTDPAPSPEAPVTLAPTAVAEYAWPTCTACGYALPETDTDRQACRHCEERASVRLRELPALFARVNSTAALVRGARRTGGAA